MIDYKKLTEDFNEEINDAVKYHAMAIESTGCDHQILIDMAWDEYSHAKHIHRILKEHNIPTEGQSEVLHRTKEVLEEDRWWH